MFIKLTCIFAFMAFSITMGAAEAKDPLQELDILSSHRTHNRHQCRRLCWYRKACGRYSFYTKNDSPEDNCVLHFRQQTVPNLLDGWFDEEASGSYLSPDHGCSFRPCTEREMCIPIYGHKKYICANASTGAWLGQSCTSLACHSPPSAGNTSCFHGQCLCAPGYFYSVSRRACVANCTDLGNSYLRYQGYDFFGSNHRELHPVNDVAECETWCSSDPLCLLFVHVRESQWCYSKSATALDYPAAWLSDPNDDTYQKTCA